MYQNLKSLLLDEHPVKICGMHNFGNRLREWRELKGLSLYYINKVTGVPTPNLVSIEKGRRPASNEVLRKLASIPELQISYEVLKAWKLADEVNPKQAIELILMLFPDKDELKKVLKQVGVEL